jgi:hypothetical protein
VEKEWRENSFSVNSAVDGGEVSGFACFVGGREIDFQQCDSFELCTDDSLLRTSVFAKSC